MMTTSPYLILKTATDKYFADPTKINKKAAVITAYLLLKKNGIQMRNGDKNIPIQFNLSFPKERYIVFGIRYLKSGQHPYKIGSKPRLLVCKKFQEKLQVLHIDF